MEQKTLTVEKLNFELWRAARDGNLSSVKEFLSKGANINYQLSVKINLFLNSFLFNSLFIYY